MVHVAMLLAAWHVARAQLVKYQPHESSLCAPNIQRARGIWEALNGDVPDQQMNGERSRPSFFTDSL